MITVRVYDDYNSIALQAVDTDDLEGCEFSKKFRAKSSGDMEKLIDCSTSEASKKFSRAQKYMFKVSRRCSWIRAFERTNSHGHTTHRSKNFAVFRFLWKKTHARIPF